MIWSYAALRRLYWCSLALRFYGMKIKLHQMVARKLLELEPRVLNKRTDMLTIEARPRLPEDCARAIKSIS
jgi:hypothetical protein